MESQGDVTMENELISIVVPVYNVEKYLEECVTSITQQTYSNLEIVLVNDGSLDTCPKICEAWKKKDSRIKVIHKENAGLGMARNTGIDNATGQYICFFDSDDYIEVDTIEKCYQEITKESADIALFGYSRADGSGNIVRKAIPYTDERVYSGEVVRSKFLPDLISNPPGTGMKTQIWMSACMAMYSMELINRANWRFASEREIISEDVYSLLVLYKDVRKVVIIPEALYIYRTNEQSLTNTYRKDRYQKIKYFYECSCEVSRQCGYSKEVSKRLMWAYLSFTVAAMKQIANADMSMREKRMELKEIIRDTKLQEVIKEVNVQHQPIVRKALFVAMQFKLEWLCYLLFKMNGMRKKEK